MAQRNVILSADSTCDLGDELKARYDVHYYPFHIILEDRDYQDNVDIHVQEIYQAYYDRKVLPRTAAINVGEYADYFRPFVEAGYDVVHFCLGGALSSAQKNCQLAAQEPDLAGHVFPIDSFSLSTGIALQVIEAGDRIRQGLPAAQVAQEVSALRQHCHASFILDTLTFMKAGGRCSAVVAFGANLLNLKPCIEVDNTSGAMHVGKKYRGAWRRSCPSTSGTSWPCTPRSNGTTCSSPTPPSTRLSSSWCGKRCRRPCLSRRSTSPPPAAPSPVTAAPTLWASCLRRKIEKGGSLQASLFCERAQHPGACSKWKDKRGKP